MRGVRVGLVAVASMAVVACGGGGEDTVTVEASPAALARAVDDTVSSGSGGRFTASIDVDLGGQAVDIAMDGAFDGAQRSELVVELDLGDLGGPGLLPGFEEPMRLVTDGADVYLCGDIVATLGGTTECGRLPSDATSSVVPGGGNPLEALDQLVDTADVEEVGQEDVDGVATTHLRGTIDVGQALAGLLGAVGATDLALPSEPQPFDVWVDGDGRIRRYLLTLDADGLGMTMDIRLRDLGDEVDIDVPAPDEADELDLPGMLGG